MSTQHHTRVLERFCDQATALDTEAVKAEASVQQLAQTIATGQQQRTQIAADLTELERRVHEQRIWLASIDEDLAVRQVALENAQRDAVDYRAEAAAVRAIVAREVAVLEQQDGRALPAVGQPVAGPGAYPTAPMRPAGDQAPEVRDA